MKPAAAAGSLAGGPKCNLRIRHYAMNYTDLAGSPEPAAAAAERRRLVGSKLNPKP